MVKLKVKKSNELQFGTEVVTCNYLAYNRYNSVVANAQMNTRNRKLPLALAHVLLQYQQVQQLGVLATACITQY